LPLPDFSDPDQPLTDDDVTRRVGPDSVQKFPEVRRAEIVITMPLTIIV
jgi:hypothetical protein